MTKQDEIREGMVRCIKCDTESEHAICGHCADELIDNMSLADLVAHALVGMDAINGKDKLMERLKNYKALLGQ